MRSRVVTRVAVLGVLALSSAAMSLRASDVVPSAAAGVAGDPSVPRLVVMHGGKVVEGSLRTASGGYELETPNGRVFIADSYIWFTAENRLEAYRTLRERIPEASAGTHVKIAQWCIENRLHHQAKEELRLALRIEPQHVDARTMLRLLEPSSAASENSGAKLRPSPLDPVQTLGNLPHHAAQEFVTRIQPLLVNRCGNANCHGAASGHAFTLRTVRPGVPAYRSLTEQNPDAVRKLISYESPETSPLLAAAATATSTGHGGPRKPLFPGPTGAAQLRGLAQWVRDVAASDPALARTREPAELKLASPENRTTEIVPASAELPLAPAAEPSDATAALLQSVISDERPDAFDPNEFNRRFGPRAGQAPLAPSDGPTR